MGALGFQNLYAFAMNRQRAAELGITSIEDLIARGSELSAGGDMEFFGRPEWYSVRDTYGFDFDRKLTFDPALMYQAVADNQIDVITAYTSDGRVAAYDLLILEDPRQALLPYDGILIASPEAARDEQLMELLEPLIGRIDDSLMRAANKIVDVDGGSVPEAVAFLRAAIAD